MKTTMKLASFLLLASCLAAHAETGERHNKRFTVQPGGVLILEVDLGSVDVKTTDGNEVVVDVLRRVTRASKEEEEEFLAARPVTIEAVANTVRIGSKAPAKETTASRGRQRTECKYTITVPAKFDAQLRTGGGAIAVTGVTGDVKARSAGGGLTFAQLRGPLDASTGGGAIRVTDCEGVQRLKSAGGGLEVAGGSGSIEGNTGGGLVKVKDFKGDVDLKNAGGGLTFDNVTGRVNASTGGGAIAARFAVPPADEVNLTTAGGGVTVEVPDNAAFNLDAATAGGNVSSELTVAGAAPKKKGPQNKLKGTVNGGGKAVTLRTGGGGIQVRKS